MPIPFGRSLCAPSSDVPRTDDTPNDATGDVDGTDGAGPAADAPTSTVSTPPSTPTAPASADDAFVADASDPAPVVDDVPGPDARPPLPQTLMTSPLATVEQGTDPGDFYCEHMFFSAQSASTAPDSLVATNDAGERLVGFLHVPWDAHTSRSPPASDDDASYTQADRHAGTRAVLGAAVAGFMDDMCAAADVEGADVPARLLLTGYDPFGTARNNPTGDFVAHPENVDACIQDAFGDAVVVPGERVPGGVPGEDYALRYRVERDGVARELLVFLRRFPVDDTAIDGEAASIQGAMKDAAPHGVISMGVAPGRTHRAEYHADTGGMRVVDGRARHDASAPPSLDLPDNRALGRAIHRGSQSQPAAVPASGALGGFGFGDV